jgi:PAS domain S-box-containing protein
MNDKATARFLGHREQQLRLALDAARMISFDWNLATGVCHRSRNALAVFGLRTDRAEEFYDCVHPDDREKFADAVARASDGDGEYEVELRIITADGRALWVLDRGRLRLDALTQQLHLTGVCMDITERKQVAQERERALATLNSLIASAPMGITLLDDQMRYQLINQPLARMNGIPPAEHIGRSVAEILPQALEFAEPLFREVLQTGRPIADQVLELEAADEPGLRRAFRESWFPVAGLDDRPSGVGVIVQDITGERRAERRLAKKNERLALLSEASAALLQAEDPNELLPSLFGKIGPHLGLDAYFHFLMSEGKDALQLASCVGIAPDDARSLARLEFGQAICGSVALHRSPLVATRIQQSEDPVVGRVKQLGFRAYACHPLISGNELVGTLSFATRSRDEFDPDELEFLLTICRYVAVAYERTRLVEQLRDSDRRKDEFLAVLAHELRNPLAPIRNALQLIRLADGTREVIDQAADTMERQVEHMVRLIDDLLDVSRITRGKIELRRQPLELAAAIRNAVEASAPLIDAFRHQLTVTLPPEPVHVDGDPTRLAQIFTNLLTNAAKYTESGGRVWLTVQRQADQVQVSVRDSGIGIAAEQLGGLFTMFSQVAPLMERSRGGLGIGLALVKGLVELHGGSVHARSEGPGKGSEFVVRLPVMRSPQPEPAVPERPSTTTWSRCRVLVVDDNRDSADSLACVLRLMGHDVLAVYDGLEALEAGEPFAPDVVLLDIGLPKMNGYDVARGIRQSRWGRHTKVIATTGWGKEEDKRRAGEAGFDEHLTKPVDPVALERLLVPLRT